MITIERTKTFSVEISVEEIAMAFCEMDADEQACFFNLISEISSGWEKPFCFQLQKISDSKFLTTAGRNIMERIGEYSDK